MFSFVVACGCAATSVCCVRRHVSKGMPSIKHWGFGVPWRAQSVVSLLDEGCAPRAPGAGGIGPRAAPRQAGRVLMPAGDTDSDAASNAAATKVQAILRGSAARKTVTKSAASARKKVCWSTGWWPQGWNGIGGEGWRRRGWSQWHVGGEEGCGDGGGCVGGGGDGGLS